MESTAKTKDGAPSPDQEMLKNIDLLLNMDVLQSEDDWQTIGDLDQEHPIEALEEPAGKAENNGE